MTITRGETQAGATALKAYIDRMLTANGLAWEEMFIPDNAYIDGANDVIEAADEAKEQTQAARLNAGVEALAVAIADAGQADKVSQTNLVEATGEILTAVAKVRAQENPPQKPQPAPPPAPEQPQDGPQTPPPPDPADPNADQPAATQSGVAGNPQPSESTDA